MDIFDFLSLIGGLALFLFGMNVMGEALEKRAGNQLKSILEKLTSSRWKGFLLGAGVTSIRQSSSATTVMVVGQPAETYIFYSGSGTHRYCTNHEKEE